MQNCGPSVLPIPHYLLVGWLLFSRQIRLNSQITAATDIAVITNDWAMLVVSGVTMMAAKNDKVRRLLPSLMPIATNVVTSHRS